VSRVCAKTAVILETWTLEASEPLPWIPKLSRLGHGLRVRRETVPEGSVSLPTQASRRTRWPVAKLIQIFPPK